MTYFALVNKSGKSTLISHDGGTLHRFLRGAHDSVRTEARMAAPESVVVRNGIRTSFWNTLMSFLSSVKVISGGDKCYFAEVTKRRHEVSDR